MSYTYICIRYYIFLLLLLERWICRVSIPHLFFSFGHCSICPTFYNFWLPLWNTKPLLSQIWRQNKLYLHFFPNIYYIEDIILILPKVLWNWYHQHARFFYWQHICFPGGRNFQQTVAIPMGTNCAPLLADLFLYSYEADCIQGPLQKSEKKLARPFNCTLRYIDDVP